MLNAFNRPPNRQPYIAFHVGPPPAGDSTFRSLDLSVPQLPVHFAGRSYPCFGNGCPLCPTAARPMVYLPCMLSGVPRPLLLSIPSTLQLTDLAKDWGLGWTLKIKRSARITKIVLVEQSLHQPCKVVTDRDVQQSLATLWRLPSPDDFANEEAWVAASIQAVTRALKHP